MFARFACEDLYHKILEKFRCVIGLENSFGNYFEKLF